VLFAHSLRLQKHECPKPEDGRAVTGRLRRRVPFRDSLWMPLTARTTVRHRSRPSRRRRKLPRVPARTLFARRRCQRSGGNRSAADAASVLQKRWQRQCFRDRCGSARRRKSACIGDCAGRWRLPPWCQAEGMRAHTSGEGKERMELDSRKAACPHGSVLRRRSAGKPVRSASGGRWCGAGALRGVPAGMGSRARSSGEGKAFPNKNNSNITPAELSCPKIYVHITLWVDFMEILKYR